MATTPIRNLRKTLIIGLGGSGCRIALELKARMEERAGGRAAYGGAVKFVFIDTAKENFTANQPNHPERPPVEMEGDEFISISDVPLEDLTESKANNPGLRAILPPTLYTTQIDQGAQQVRRLGRVALFYHYARTVKGRLSAAISDLYGMATVDGLSNADGTQTRVSERLRVYIIGSVCGGTGGGTFIDIAYLTRHIVRSLGKERNERQLTTTGVLLLPEAFPDIVTTGAQRIRANAYASLLDLEHFNQPTDANTPLYDVELPEEGRVQVGGAPFTWCYLVGSGPYTLHGKVDLEPILAETLYLNIATRMGEQLDATLDNIRPYLMLDYRGYRAFYSALGFSQIIYPDLWIRQRFGLKLQALLAAGVLEGEPTRTDSDLPDLRTWLDGLTDGVFDRMASVKSAFSQAKQRLTRSDDIIGAVERACQEANQRYSSDVVEVVKQNSTAVLRRAKAALNSEFNAQLNHPDGLGLVRAAAWLDELMRMLDTEIRDRQQDDTDSTPDRLFDGAVQRLHRTLESDLPGVGFVRRVRHGEAALEDLKRDLSAYHDRRTIGQARLTLCRALKAQAEGLRYDLKQAQEVWDRLKKQTEAQAKSATSKPVYPPSTTLVMDAAAVDDKAEKLAEGILKSGGLVAAFAKSLKGLSSTLPSGAAHDNLAQRLEAFCAGKYDDVGGSVGDADLTADRIRSMEAKGAPLLRWSEGMVQHMAPREVKVIGADTPVVGDSVKQKMLKQDDLTAIPTNDPTAVTFLSTVHGLPAVALTNFELYRQQYVELARQQRNAIFHMSETLEDAPHDPGSRSFFDPNAVALAFGRALASGNITCIDNPENKDNKPIENVGRLFAFSAALFSLIKAYCAQTLRQMDERITQAVADGNPLLAASVRAARTALETLKEEIESHRAQSGDLREYNRNEFPYALRLKRMNNYGYAITLAEALDALEANRDLLRAFYEAVNGGDIPDAPNFQMKEALDKLRTGGYSANAADRGRSAAVASRLAEVLGEHYRLRLLKERNKAENRPPLAYYAPPDEVKGSSKGSAPSAGVTG